MDPPPAPSETYTMKNIIEVPSLKDILEVKRASREEVSDLILNVRMALRIL
jgi:hypothetical protein